MEPTPLQRALAIAPDRPSAKAARLDEEIFVFRVAELTFAIASGQVREVTRMSVMTPLPRAPSFVLGVVGHRGLVMPVIDLLRFLGQGESKPTARSRLVVGENGALMVSCLADSVVGLRRILVTDRLPAPMGAGITNEFVSGLVHSSEHGTLTLLNLPRVMQAARQKVVAR